MSSSTPAPTPVPGSIRPADRYGDRPARPRPKALWITLAGFVVAVLVFAGSAAVERSRYGVNWIELGVTAQSSRTATITFQVTLPAGRAGVCTVRVVNDALTEVGRADVVVGPDPDGVVRTTTTMRTAELATGGGVKGCVVRR